LGELLSKVSRWLLLKQNSATNLSSGAVTSGQAAQASRHLRAGVWVWVWVRVGVCGRGCGCGCGGIAEERGVGGGWGSRQAGERSTAQRSGQARPPVFRSPAAPHCARSLEHHRHVLRVEPVEQQPVGAARGGGGGDAPEVAEEADHQLLRDLLLECLGAVVRGGVARSARRGSR